MSWYSRFWKKFSGPAQAPVKFRELDVATGDFPSPTSLSHIPGSIKLSVGIVSTVGNHREHNEDNFFVPGHRSIVHGGSTESSTEMPAVLEAANLSKLLEEKWGVSAAAPVAAAAAGGAAAAPAEVKDEFTVMLTAAGDKKIEVI